MTFERQRNMKLARQEGGGRSGMRLRRGKKEITVHYMRKIEN